MSGQFHAMADVPMVEGPWLPTIGGWLDPRAGLDVFGGERILLAKQGIELWAIQQVA